MKNDRARFIRFLCFGPKFDAPALPPEALQIHGLAIYDPTKRCANASRKRIGVELGLRLVRYVGEYQYRAATRFRCRLSRRRTTVGRILQAWELPSAIAR